MNVLICTNDVKDNQGNLFAIKGNMYEVGYSLEMGKPYIIDETDEMRYFDQEWGLKHFREFQEKKKNSVTKL